MKKEELIRQLCLPDEVGGDIVKRNLTRKLADVPDEGDINQFRNMIETALNAFFGRTPPLTIMPDTDDIIGIMWKSYTDRLKRLIEEDQKQ